MSVDLDDIVSDIDANPPAPVLIDIPDDVETEQLSPLDRVKAALSAGGGATVTRRRGRPPGSRNKPKESAASQITATEFGKGFLAPLVALAMLTIPAETRMNQQEREGVCVPLARILTRRFKILEKFSPDLIDGMAIVVAISAYVQRLEYEARQRQQISTHNDQRLQNEPARYSPPIVNGAGGPVLDGGTLPTGDPVAALFGKPAG